MNSSEIVNAINRPSLDEALAGRLRDFLGSIKWLKSWRIEHIADRYPHDFDLIARLPTPNGVVKLCVECKRELRSSAFAAMAERMICRSKRGETAVPVLAAPYVSTRLADLCRQYGWSWYDLAGNYHIEVPGLLYLERQGLPPVHEQPRPKANLSTPEAGRVIRALLAPENAGRRWTQREMKAHFGKLPKPRIGPSLGLVNKVVQHLRDEAFVETLEDGGFRVHDPLRLLFAWRDAYRFDRHARHGYFTLLRGTQLRDSLHKLDLQSGGFAAYAAFSAAEIQAPHVRQPKTWIFVAAGYLRDFEALLEAKRVDSGENVMVLVPGDEGVFYMAESHQSLLGCTNAVQTYVDVFHCGGRGQEAAEAVLEQRLKPMWKGL